MKQGGNVAVIEMFNGGSHAQFLSYLREIMPGAHYLMLSGKKWHWNARCGTLQILPQLAALPPEVDTVFMTAVGNLPEVIGLSPSALARARKIVYFHENQLVYPNQKNKERDYQYGYNQVVSAIAADCILFNSCFNMESFYGAVPSYVNRIPGFTCPANLISVLREKSSVLYYPVSLPPSITSPDFEQPQPASSDRTRIRILWPHRWEHDKNPEMFFGCIKVLLDENLDFEISVLGQPYSELPEVMATALKTIPPSRIVQWGRLEDRDSYLDHIGTCDVVISTARHEFFGVAVMEAVARGCFPLLPNRLSYPEIYPRECLYNTEVQLVKQLRQLCKNPSLARKKWKRVVELISFERFSWEKLKPYYCRLLGVYKD